MERIRKSLILLLASAPAAAATLPFVGTPTHDICITTGSVTYQLSSTARVPDYRVRIDNTAAHPDLKVQLVDRAELADFALVDDSDAPAASRCATAGPRRTVKIVGATDAADAIIALAREPAGSDVALFVHSTHVTHQDAAALFALMRHVQAPQTVAAFR